MPRGKNATLPKFNKLHIEKLSEFNRPFAEFLIGWP